MPTSTAPIALALMAGAGCLASAINSFAGGGSLVSFPTLVGFGMGTVPANATNSVALWAGNVSSAIGYLNKVKKAMGQLPLLMPVTLACALLGAWLLTVTPESLFKILVPVLILVATLLLAFQKQIKAKVEAGSWHTSRITGAVLQGVVSVYGGYFGAGMGIMMLAVLSLFVEGDLHELNAIKNWLTVLVNLASTVVFVWNRLVEPVPCLAMMAGALAGGVIGAKYSQKVHSETLRKVIVAYGFIMTAWFVWSLRK